MNATITFDEISNIILKKIHVRPTLKQIDDKTIEIRYKPAMFIPEITITVHIASMRSDVICLMYSCHEAAALLIGGIVGFVKSNIPDGIEVNTADKRINLYPLQIKKLEKVFEYISLSDISFTVDAVNISFTLV